MNLREELHGALKALGLFAVGAVVLAGVILWPCVMCNPKAASAAALDPEYAAFFAAMAVPSANTNSACVEETFGTVKRIKFTWFSDPDGAEALQTTNTYSGRILTVETDPNAGDGAPTASYDITLTDGESVDVLAGAGANRHTSNIEYLLEGVLGTVANDKLTLNVSAAGDTNGGVVHVWIR